MNTALDIFANKHSDYVMIGTSATRIRSSLVLAAALLCCGPGSASAPEADDATTELSATPPKLQVYIANLNNSFHRELASALEDLSAQCRLELEITQGQGRHEDTAAFVASLPNPPGPIIMIPTDEASSSQAAHKSRQGHQPLIFLATEPGANALNIYGQAVYVGSENGQLGALQATALNRLWQTQPQVDRNYDGKLQLLLIKGNGAQPAAARRVKAFKGLAKRLQLPLKIVAEKEGMWQEDVAYALTQEQLSSGVQFEAVVCSSDKMALGALKALREAGFNLPSAAPDSKSGQNIPILSIDGIPQAVAELKQGGLYSTVYQDAPAMARAALQFALPELSCLQASRPKMTHQEHLYISAQVLLQGGETAPDLLEQTEALKVL